MAKGRLQSVKNVEGDILKIAGIGVLGTVAIYALIKSAPALGDLFNKGISNIVSGIVSGLPDFSKIGSSLSGTSPDQAPASGGQSLADFLKANPHPAETGAAPYVAHDYSGHGQLITVSPADLVTAEKILGGFQNPVNLSDIQNAGIKAAENTLIAGLGQSDLQKLTGETKPIVGTFQTYPGSPVVPLTQDAVDYYNTHHGHLVQITKF